MFENDILPIIGNRIITDIDPIELVNVIRLFENAAQWKEQVKLEGDVAKFSLCNCYRKSKI